MMQVRNVTKWFGDAKVLDRVSFVLNRGDRAGLIGPNGCGKTTLLRILTGELAPDEGSVRVAPATLRVFYLPQAPEFPAGVTVGEVLGAADGDYTAVETRLARLAETASLAAARSDLIMDDPANSKWFTYSYPGPSGASCTYSAGVKAGIAVGTFTDGSVSATSIITTAGNPVHSAGDFKPYLPMFQ